jgi:hypothetical protein
MSKIIRDLAASRRSRDRIHAVERTKEWSNRRQHLVQKKGDHENRSKGLHRAVSDMEIAPYLELLVFGVVDFPIKPGCLLQAGLKRFELERRKSAMRIGALSSSATSGLAGIVIAFLCSIAGSRATRLLRSCIRHFSSFREKPRA